VLHEVFDLAKFFAAAFALVLLKHFSWASSVPVIPAFFAKVSLNLPGRFGVVVDDPQLAVAHGAKICPFFMFAILFREARPAEKRARFHFPLPLGLVPVLIGDDILATNRALVRRYFFGLLAHHCFLGLVDMAV
jgi:hypothetical protein